MRPIEIRHRSGLLLLGIPGTFDKMLERASDRLHLNSVLRSMAHDTLAMNQLQTHWRQLFPARSSQALSPGEMLRHLSRSIGSGRIHAVQIGQTRRMIEMASASEDRFSVVHLAMGSQTVLVARRGQLPPEFARRANPEAAARALRGMPQAHSAIKQLEGQTGRLGRAVPENAGGAALRHNLGSMLQHGHLDGVVLTSAQSLSRAATLPSAPKPVSAMSAKDKIYAAIARSRALVGNDLRHALEELSKPRNLAMIVGFMLVLAGVQLIPGVDVLVDAGMLIWLLYTVGTKGVAGFKGLIAATEQAVEAQTDAALEHAARTYAHAFEDLGEAGISALLAWLQGLRLAGRFAKAGEVEGAGAAARQKPAAADRPAPQPRNQARNANAASKASQFKTKPNEATFWSGLGSGGPEKAKAFTRSSGGKTLEQLMEERGIELPVFDRNNPASLSAWDEASRMFAQGASGDVKAVLGNVNPQSVWNRIELPALKANPNITSITGVDPVTGLAKVLWP